MRAKIHVPTDQYAFIELDYECPGPDEEMSLGDLVEVHAKLSEMVGDKVGLNDRDFAPIRHKVFKGEPLTVPEYEKLEEEGSARQLYVINEFKKESRKDGKSR